MKQIKESELILNPDGSIYHLNVKPEHIARDIIFVGDQDRVAEITAYFDHIEHTTQKREFRTQTGMYKGKRLTVISTGIGPDNIDIVLNELDALVNIDFTTRTVKPAHTSLNIVRIGTSGSLQLNLDVDAFLMSKYAIGTDNMLRSYDISELTDVEMEAAFTAHTKWNKDKGKPYAVKASETLTAKFRSDEISEGITVTAAGFYGAQGRVLRLKLEDEGLNDKIDSFAFKGLYATNLEMETAAIYGLSKLLGHNAVSLNAIVANRRNGSFSPDPYEAVRKLILFVLNKIIE